MSSAHAKDLIYISRSRLHRNRANLIQTLHTAAAFQSIGINTQLFMPPLDPRLALPDRLRDLGIASPLVISPTQLLHTRFKFWPFFVFRRAYLAQARAIYVRSPEFSRMLVMLRLPHVLEVHDAVGDLDRAGLLRSVVAWHRKGIIQRLVPISHSAAGTLLRAGADAKRVVVAPSAVDLAAYADVPEFDPARLNSPHFVYIGTLAHERGMTILEQLAHDGVGRVTMIGEAAQGYISPPLLTPKPFVPHYQVPGWYAQSDIVLLPYQAEIATAGSMSPMKLFEALAAGRPIVASDLPAIREVLTHEQNALLVTANDIGAWKSAIRRLQNDRQLAVKLARAARETAKDHSWEKRAERIARACSWCV